MPSIWEMSEQEMSEYADYLKKHGYWIEEKDLQQP